MRTSVIAAFTLLLGSMVLSLGCGSGASAKTNPQAKADGTRFLLADEPADAIGVAEAKDALNDHSGEIVLVGRIDAGSHEPWEEGKAAFMLKDAMAVIESSHHHDVPGHDPETCPYCKQAHAGNETLAIIQFEDDTGEVLPVDARELLGLEKGQLVVVRGRGAVNELGSVVVSADGIYVRQ